MTEFIDDTDELIRRAALADPEATAALFARHRGQLKRMVSLRLDPRLRRRLDASDIVQDVLTDAVKRLPDYLVNRPLPFYPWLRRLVRQRLVDAYRTHVVADRRSVKRERFSNPRLPDQSAALLAAALVAQQSSPSQQMYRSEKREQVRDALNHLRYNDREILVLRYLEQCSFDEIAEELRMNESAAKMRHLRALQRLGRLLRKRSSGGTSGASFVQE